MSQRLLIFAVVSVVHFALAASEGAQGQDGHARAGNPLGIARWAIPSDTGAYVPNRVGGGNPCPKKAEPPFAEEGTWGWDYQGRCFRRNVLLGWWHGRRYQGGTGAYKTDGPKLKAPGEEDK